MLRALPGADPATEADGKTLTVRAVDLYESQVSETQRKFVTIAVGAVDNMLVAVVYHPKLRTAERMAGRLREVGLAATATSGTDHAEAVLYQREAGITAIGISNASGPCPACRAFFANVPSGFAHVYWDDEAWLFP
jgi:hypothetical protein